ncbi:replicative DNA helicase [Massiliimalia massiliensis]|uniref:replicative DNA helicase n=1 Tax=Massiliimalia massiliensis TaxID=1852384 RepID=UPI0009860DC2|nr:replicative DNA helicase [Massiliimalia massiliensis]
MAEYSEFDLENQPYSLEAEQSVLGGILINPDCFSTVLEVLTRSDMFYRRQHAELYDIFLSMFNLSKPIDFITVLDEVNQAHIFEDETSAKVYLAQLMEMVPSTANITNYCQIVLNRYYRRRLILAAKEIEEYARDEEGTATQLMDMAEQKLYDIRQGKDNSELIPIDKVIIGTYDRLQKLTGEDRDLYLGLSSGFSRLDAMMTGLNKSDLILLAARPGMGKTSFALNIATNVAKKYEKDVVVFSLEMSSEQLVSRILSSEAQISSQDLRLGKLSPDQWVQLAASADILSKTNMYLDDTPGITVAEMKAKVRRLKNLGLIVIDYLQLMTGSGRSENRVQEVSKITRNLKIMAKELNIPVIVLSQLNRSAEQRPDHKPMLSDLRESGSIEQDADIVMFLFRAGYYDKEIENPNVAQCILAKNRHGSTGEVDLSWIGEFTRFGNLEVSRDEPPF